MITEVDLLILGGGCAGLSLATRLAALGKACPSVLVLEQRTAYSNDRTWCFWADGDPRWRDQIAHEWHALQLRWAGKTVAFDCGSRPYQMLPASRFYDHALHVLEQSPAITLALGQKVSAAPVRSAAGWTVTCSLGSVTAKNVIDTRQTGTPAAGGATLWQSFYGQEVCCDAAVFAPLAADLMDFRAGTQGQIPFTYVLPISPHRALVEATVFGPHPLGTEALSAPLADAIRRCTAGHAWSVIRSEQGVLPMGLASAPRSLGVGHVAVGVMAGGARASSGFAFQRIQRWADQCCAAIAAGQRPTGHRQDPWLVRTMDRLFLRVLRASPKAAPGLFMALFEHADSAGLIRFMSGKSTVSDCLGVIRALPARHVVRQLFSPDTPAIAHRAG